MENDKINLMDSNDKNQFFNLAIHDLRALLRNIRSLAGFIQDELGNDLLAQVKCDFGLLDARVDRMQGLLDGIHQYLDEKNDNDVFQNINLRQLIFKTLISNAIKHHNLREGQILIEFESNARI